MNINETNQIVWILALLAVTFLAFYLPFLPALQTLRKTNQNGVQIDQHNDGSAGYAVKKAAVQYGQSHQSAQPNLDIADSQSVDVAVGNVCTTIGSRTTIRKAAAGDTVYVKQYSKLPGVVMAHQTLYLESNCEFSWLDAPTICFVHVEPDIIYLNHQLAPVRKTHKMTVQKFIRYKGDLCMKADETLHYDYVITGDLDVAEGCTMTGSCKVYGDVRIGIGAHIWGSVFSERNITMAQTSFVAGVLSATDTILLGHDSVVGAKEQLSTVTARKIFVQPGAVVHGSIRAIENGRSLPLGVAL